MMRRLAVFAASTLLLGMGAATAQDYTLSPVSGQAKLSDGFQPDPRTVDVTAGGPVNGTTVGAACNGFITDAPTYRIFYTAGANPLIFSIDAAEDTTLIISDPQANWICDDDSAGNLNPQVSFDTPLSGQYDIWVGTYSQTAEGTDATLTITAQGTVAGQGALDWSLTPLFGEVNLNTGFTPDPHVVDVEAGGDVDAYTVDDACWGYATEAPTYRLQYQSGTFPLYIYAYAEDDTDLVLIVSDPNGNWICDDDSAGGLNPLVSFDTPLSGQYDIWVGTYGGGEPVAASLNISEIEPENISSTGPLNWDLTPAYGEQDIGAGFTPDPITIDITAGGDVDARLVMDTCRGWVAEGPTYRIYYTAGDFPLTFRVQSDTDTTLVIADPNGDYLCDDDSAGSLNPQITFNPALDGVYDIWVGTYGENTDVPATLQITELGDNAGPGPRPGPVPTTGTLDYTLDPVAGTNTVNNGFLPDPIEVAVTAGGGVNVNSALSNNCRGYATAEPTYRLNYTAGSYPLAFWVEASADTTLIISDPNGTWICDDDSGVGLNPAVYLESPLSGQYDIWVGTYGNTTGQATLRISETTNPVDNGNPLPTPPTNTTGALDATLAPNYGEVTLAAGFSPDPQTIELMAGGDIGAANAADASCRGYVAAAPDYRLTYTAGTWPLFISVMSEADTTLVIQGPDDTWYCDDDSGEGLNPLYRFETPANGQYNIWVGTYSAGQPQAATLHISEIGGAP